MARAPRPVRRVERHPDAAVDVTAWPDSVPAVTQLLTRGLDLPAGVTFLVGENGAGKSTVVEAVAEAVGAHREGGSSAHLAGVDRGDHEDTSDLAGRLRVVRSGGGRRGAFFLRAETMHRFYSYLDETYADVRDHRPPHHLRSHGESFLGVLGTKRWFRDAGVVLLDEPESALSFDNCLLLAGSLARMAADGKQVLCATHSPLLTALPGANVLQLDEHGMTPVAWEELAVVRNWRFFLDAPERFLRHVL
ncbi:AAA family ATPase [Kineococcus sp. R8]|uniref:AAA family ATPase n=1 Tax=Kineococcus siccus TaxID=2696567 RepID=UPI0014128AE7|nr:AAA family ATPase [Kineococcus siccus]NAZ81268.1 AAA family ATPase [Kineococcus siccus]